MMISVIYGMLDLIRSTFNTEFVILPVSTALIATLGCLIIGIIKQRG